MDDAVAAVVARETEGNPFFIREVLRHLVEEGRIRRGADGRWSSELPAQELGIPEGVRQVIRRRLARLSGDANRLLGAACSFEGPFRLQVAAGVADLGEEVALDALDEALDAQLLEAAGATDCYAFTHALVRHTLYEELSPSRRARLHRQVAVDLEAAVAASPSPAELGEIAVQYHRSVGLPGGERGVAPALAAAAYAEDTGGQREAARFLRLALDLLPSGDARRPRLLGRLGMALIWGLASDEGVAVAGHAGEAIAAAEGPDAAADYLAEAAAALGLGGNNPLAWELARQGLRHAGERRDLTWARLVQLDHFRRETQDAKYPGIPIETPERWEAARIIRSRQSRPRGLRRLGDTPRVTGRGPHQPEPGDPGRLGRRIRRHPPGRRSRGPGGVAPGPGSFERPAPGSFRRSATWPSGTWRQDGPPWRKANASPPVSARRSSSPSTPGSCSPRSSTRTRISSWSPTPSAACRRDWFPPRPGLWALPTPSRRARPPG